MDDEPSRSLITDEQLRQYLDELLDKIVPKLEAADCGIDFDEKPVGEVIVAIAATGLTEGIQIGVTAAVARLAIEFQEQYGEQLQFRPRLNLSAHVVWPGDEDLDR